MHAGRRRREVCRNSEKFMGVRRVIDRMLYRLRTRPRLAALKIHPHFWRLFNRGLVTYGGGTRRLSSVIFFAAAVINDLLPECDEVPLHGYSEGRGFAALI